MIMLRVCSHSNNSIVRKFEKAFLAVA